MRISYGSVFVDQSITVVARALSKIDITTPPSDVSYVEGQTFNPAGMTIKATYNDNSVEYVNYNDRPTAFTFTPSLAATLTTSDKSVSVTYGGKPATQGITVVAKAVTGIRIKTPPAKVNYAEGDSFTPAGMVITATFNDSSTQEITVSAHLPDFTLSPSGLLASSTTAILITYGGQNASQPITVTDKPTITDPTNQSIVVGQHASLSVTASADNGLLTFQWYSGTSVTGPFSPIGGATSALFITPTFAAPATVYYYCKATNTLNDVSLSTSSAVASVTVKDNDTTLKSMTATAGTFTPGFSPATTEYTLLLTEATESTTITVEKNSDLASVDFNTKDVSLNKGDTKTVSFTITAQDNSVKTYVIHVVRAGDSDNTLKNMTATVGTFTPDFGSTKTEYTLNLAEADASTTITVVKNSDVASVDHNTLTATPGKGQTETVTFTVTAQNNSTKAYTVHVVRAKDSNKDLRSLTASAGTFDKPFDANVISYTLTLNESTASVNLTAVADSTLATVSPASPYTVAINNGSFKTVMFTVMAQNGDTKDYTVKVVRDESSDATLGSLSATAGTFNPSFSTGITSYTLTLNDKTPTTDLSAAANSALAVVVPAAKSVTLDRGASESVKFTVTAQNGITKEYTVNVIRSKESNNNLQNLSATIGTLDPSFSASVNSYTLTLDEGTPSTELSAEAASKFATVSPNSPQSVTLAKGTSQKVTFTVTAEDGTKQEYSVNVVRAGDSDNTLKSITASAGTFTPATFTPATKAYSLAIPETTKSVTITVEANSASATVTTGLSQAVTLAKGETKTVTFTVKAQNGSMQDYTVAVTRDGDGLTDLKSISASAGTFDTAFDPDTTVYNLFLDDATERTTITVEANSDSAIVTPGLTKDVTLAKGASESVTFTVTSGSETKDYTINVTHALDSDKRLKSMTATAGTFFPAAFNPAVTSYELSLSAATESTTITVETASTLATVDPATPQTVTLEKGKSQNVTFKVTAQDKSTMTYTVEVSRDSDPLPPPPPSPVLTGIAIKTAPDKVSYIEGDIFNPAGMIVTASYSDGSNVPVSDYTWAPTGALTTADKAITISYNGMTATQAITVAPKAVPLSMKLTVRDTAGLALSGVGIKIYAEETLKTLVAQGVSNASGILKIDNLSAATYWVKVTSVPAGYALPGVNIPETLKAGDPNEFNIVISKSAVQGLSSDQLKDIKVTSGKLNPVFDPTKLDYKLALSETNGKVTITPVLADSSSTLYINNVKAKSKALTLVPGGSVKVKITVKTKSGVTKIYTVTVTRAKSTNAFLSKLNNYQGKLSPAFNKATTNYTLALSASQSNGRLTFKLGDGTYAKYAITVNGKSTQHLALHLNKGETKTVVITVTAQAGNKMTYTVVITRAK